LSNFNFITDSPSWYFLLCLLGGFIYAGLLYWYNPTNRFGKVLTTWLFILRFVVVSFLLALLLSPYLLRLKKETEQPIIIFAHDNTLSLVLTQDSAYYRSDYLNRLDSLAGQLQQQFNTVGYLFGQEVHEGFVPDFMGQQTDMSILFNRVERTWQNKNIGALLLFSDGIYNHGINPIFASRSFNFPIITVALGDTTPRPDLSIHDLRYNRIVYRQSEFPIEVTVSASQARGETANLKLWHNNAVIGEEQIVITSESFSKSIVFSVEPIGTGQQRYRVEISGLQQEVNLSNNRRDFYVDVIEDKQRILILAASPHPDLGAIQSVLEDHYEVDIQFARQLTAIEPQYSLLILHQLPSSLQDNKRIEDLLSAQPELPLLFIVGNQTNLRLLNSIQSGLGIQTSGRQAMLDVFPSVDPTFSLFTLEPSQRERIDKFPPLSAHFGEYSLIVSASTIIKQKIRGIETESPLITLLTNSEGRKKGFITGTGIWRWRLHDFNQNGNHETFNTLISKLVGYLLMRMDTRPLRVYSRNEFLINDEIKFTAELYNQSFELVNDVELRMEINSDDDESQYLYSFQSVESAYALNAGRLPEGSYTFRAEAELGGERYAYTGNFRVLMGSIEARNIIANHELLYALSMQTQGVMLYPEQMMRIPGLLDNDSRITSVTNYNKRYEPLIGYGWLFAMVIALLFCEWLLRKINGAY
jgi:hypothetical protein